MKFDLISDFHVEMNVEYRSTKGWQPGEPILYAWHKDRKSDVLVIAGDSANYHEDSIAVVYEAAQHYEHVVFVDGNHEFYSNYRNNRSVMRDMEYFNSMANTRNRVAKNITYLNGEVTWQTGKTLFVGANGWYNFRFTKGADPKVQEKAWRHGSNDPVCIRFGKKNRPEAIARRQADQLRDLVRGAQKNDEIEEIVVVTHTLPTETAFGQFANPSHPFFDLNGAYCNNWMSQVWEADEAGKIKAWCFGHTHERKDFFEDGIHFVCNPRGYRGERKFGNAGFNGILQVDTEETVTGSAFGEIEP